MEAELNRLVKSMTHGDAPELVLKAARADRSLARLAPELDVLYGVPQNPQYHPEVDTGIHTEMALQVAGLLSDKPRVRFAALVHDLGKGVTPQNEWPAHINHESDGVPLVEAFCLRAGLPEDWKKLGMLTSYWHLHAHRALELRPATLVDFLVETDFINQSEMFEDFLLACESDKRGRAGLHNASYLQGEFLRKLMDVVKSASLDPGRDSTAYNVREARCRATAAALPQLRSV